MISDAPFPHITTLMLSLSAGITWAIWLAGTGSGYLDKEVSHA
jgi:hypothetical protein